MHANVPAALTKREVAEVAIRNAIETGMYRPGQVISSRQIMEDLNLSVTPVREAILVLSSNGIVERHSHHSIKVSEMNAERLTGIFYVREMLEVEAVRLAAETPTDELINSLTRLNRQLETHIEHPDLREVNSLDRAFHNLLFGACGNEALSWSIHRLKSSFPMYALWSEEGRIQTSVNEHWALVNAITSRDPNAAEIAQREHLRNGLKATIVYLDRLLS